MHKFFVQESNVEKPYIYINGDDVSHISKVLRLHKDDSIQVSCSGHEYICNIIQIEKDMVTCTIECEFENTTEPDVRVTLFQALPKAAKMDYIIQKCVEAGIYRIQPVITKRVVLDLEGKDLKAKLNRWNRISLEAAKQSSRGIVPPVLKPVTFDAALDIACKMDLALIPYEDEKTTDIKEVFKKHTGIISAGIFIGPEGGFEKEEIDKCMERKIIPVTLGPRILRTETAGLVAAVLILYETDNMGGHK